MIYKYVIGAVIGGLIGGVVGHFGKCASGTCPLTGSPVGGAIFGGIIGIVLASAIGGPREVTTRSEHLIELKTEGELKEVLGRNDVVLADFYSNGCPPCRRLKPVINELATEYAGRAAVVAVNVDHLTGLAQQYGVMAIPDVKIFKAGSVERTIVGLNPKKAYTDGLEELLTAKKKTE